MATIGYAAADLISFADSSAARTVIQSTKTPAFNFSKTNTPARVFGGAIAKTRWPQDTSEGCIDDPTGQLGLQPLQTAVQNITQPVRQAGNELRQKKRRKWGPCTGNCSANATH